MQLLELRRTWIQLPYELLQQQYIDLQVAMKDCLLWIQRKQFYSKKLQFEMLIQVNVWPSSAVWMVRSNEEGLKAIEFKRFSGEIKEWLSFWTQFKKVHDENEIDANDET